MNIQFESIGKDIKYYYDIEHKVIKKKQDCKLVRDQKLSEQERENLKTYESELLRELETLKEKQINF